MILWRWYADNLCNAASMPFCACCHRSMRVQALMKPKSALRTMIAGLQQTWKLDALLLDHACVLCAAGSQSRCRLLRRLLLGCGQHARGIPGPSICGSLLIFPTHEGLL